MKKLLLALIISVTLGFRAFAALPDEGMWLPLLIDRLNSEKISAQHMSFPRYNTPTGRIVAQAYLGKEGSWGEDKSWFGESDKVDPLLASLYYAADRKAAAPEMERILNSGTHLILDRYYQSNMAHQGGKIETWEERVKFFDKLGRIELEGLGIPEEDRVIFLHMPGKIAAYLMQNRGNKKDGHESNLNHLIHAEKVYHDLAKRSLTWEEIECAPDGTIGSLKTPEEIHEEVYEIAMRTINWKTGIDPTYY